MQALAFHNTQFDIVDRSGQPWLRANQIGLALDYSDGKAIQRIYARHKDEFTDAMTGVVKLTTPSGDQETRIFSLRGAHLLAMFARTAVAKEFRHWVLDVLEGEAEAPAKAKRKPKLLPNGLTGDQQDAIKALVKARVEELPESKRAKAAITCWSSLKSKFGCTYKEISPEQFTDAVSLIARVVLEGELLGKEEQKAGTVLTDNQLYDVYFVCHHFDYLYEIFKRYNLYTHLTGLGSRAAVEMIDHFKDGAMGTWKLNQAFGAEFDAVQRRLKLNQYATWRKD